MPDCSQDGEVPAIAVHLCIGFGGVSGVVGWQRCIVAEMSIGMDVVSRGAGGPPNSSLRVKP